MNDGGADRLVFALSLVDVPDKQAAALVAIEPREQMVNYLENVLDTRPSLEAGRREDKTGRIGRTRKSSSCPGATEAQSIVGEWHRDKSAGIAASPTSPNTTLYGIGRVVWLPSTEARRMPTSSGSKRVDILPEILADLTGPLGDRVRKGIPKSTNVAQPGGSLREIRDTWGVSKEAMAGSIVPYTWL